MLIRKPSWRDVRTTQLYVEEGGELKKIEDNSDAHQLIHMEPIFDADGTRVGFVGMAVGYEVLVVPEKNNS